MSQYAGSMRINQSPGIPQAPTPLLGEIDSDVAALGSAIDDLCKRLHPVLRVEPPGIAEGKQNVSSTPLRDLECNLRSEIRRLNDVISRIDL